MSKIALSPWQNPEDGFPSDDYQDAVAVALEAAGVGVYDERRDERYDFFIKIDRSAYENGPLEWAKDGLIIGWSASEDCDPLTEEFYTTSGVPGWSWMPISDRHAGGDFVEELCTPGTKDQIAPLAEPEAVAAAVVALVCGEKPEG